MGFSPLLGNYGNGLADVIEYVIYIQTCKFARGQVGLEPWPSEYREYEMTRMTDNPIIEPNGRTKPDFMFIRRQISDEEKECLAYSESKSPPAKQIAIHGLVRYRGTSKQEYTTGVFWWYDQSKNDWVRALRQGPNEHE
jgi:hypothetical protein